eukprot:scaffold9508_cov178-Skeletonema_dohrnii-CCMP3373.AAC.5
MGRRTNDDDVVRCAFLMSSVKRRVEEDLLLQLRDLEAPQTDNMYVFVCINSRTVVEAVRSEPIRHQKYQLFALLWLSVVDWVERWLGQPMHVNVGPFHRGLLAAISIAETNPSCEI